MSQPRPVKPTQTFNSRATIKLDRPPARRPVKPGAGADSKRTKYIVLAVLWIALAVLLVYRF